ncbi:MAG: VUT family protein [Chloroflexi bacterium]|nr:MAG: VUT family protein [Chloroflexota bacterium]
MNANNARPRNYRFLSLVTAVFVTALVISNIIAVKLVSIFGLVLPAAVVLFPVAYIFGDILTEVYGYRQARRVIWTGFFCNLVAVVAIWIAGALPPVPFWTAGVYQSAAEAQTAYQAILGFTPRLLAASFTAYLVGEFLNSFVLARLKVRTQGRFLWMRTITSTLVGEGADSAIFVTLAFSGILPTPALVTTILSQWVFKVAYEILATPLTYLIVNTLKRAENEDYYDINTNFNPVSFK